jgi:hypothetical protein
VIVQVLLALGEEKNIFVGSRRSVFDAFGLAIRLVPDNVRSQVPSGLLKSEGESPRNADEVLRLETFRSGWSHIHGAHRILPIWGPPSSATRRVRITDIQPESSVVSKDAPDFLEDFGKGSDVVFNRIFQADLTRNVVVS